MNIESRRMIILKHDLDYPNKVDKVDEITSENFKNDQKVFEEWLEQHQEAFPEDVKAECNFYFHIECKQPTFERLVDMTKSIFPLGAEFWMVDEPDIEDCDPITGEGDLIFVRRKVVKHSINHTLNSISVEFESDLGSCSIPLDYLLLNFKSAIRDYDPQMYK